MRFIKKSVTAENNNPINISIKNPVTFIAAFFASGFFTGYVPFAQGTAGSFIVPAILSGILLFFHNYIPFYDQGLLIFFLFFTFIGVWSSGVCEKIWGHDPGRVVIDEIAGMLLSILFIPLSLTGLWAGFFFFRLFDIFKPFPARTAEKLPGGWGVMADDIVAGIYANISVRVVLFMISFLK